MKWFDDLWMKLTGKKKKRKPYTRKTAAKKAATTRRTKAVETALTAQDESAQATTSEQRTFVEQQPNGETKWVS